MRFIQSSLRSSLLYFFPLILLFLTAPNVKAQRVALKTNSLEYLILSPNLTLETRLSRTLSFQLGVGINPIKKPIAGLAVANFRVEPEVRYWFNRPMAKHFVAFSATAGFYSVKFNKHTYSGDALAAGFSYGYAFVLSKHWNMEAELGVGVVTTHGYDYTNDMEKPEKPNYHRILPIPIRCGLSFSYVFK